MCDDELHLARFLIVPSHTRRNYWEYGGQSPNETLFRKKYDEEQQLPLTKMIVLVAPLVLK